jgi:site-specific DNA-methyltransferase (adenine-specific)
MIEINKIYNESNLETMSRMPDGFVDLTVTSPPYDNLRNYNGYSFSFEEIVKEIYRVTKDGGVVVWVVGDATINGSETGTSFRNALYFKDCGFNLYDTMIYEKAGNGSPQKPYARYSPCFEYMFILSKGKPKTFNPIIVYGEKQGRQKKSKRQKNGSILKGIYNAGYGCPKSNIWKYAASNGSLDIGHFKHPAPFPEQLVADHIHSWSKEGDIVYDCFGGSGTTAKMAHLMKRNWILSEISEEYCNIAEKRIAPYLTIKTLF